MIVLLGSVQVQPERLEEALALSQVHVRRSRGEPGCIAHAVYLDPEDPLRLVFVERWADQAALQVHFGLSASRQFAGALTQLASAAPEMQIYQATLTG
ncbi:putative quinol monooxygenase [Pseudomonas sp. N040]|uniref:putative quinol monooxygenase n=1 Tax=Pseudomonas sp. N040 TaxID=2785325 RepID=UPI0018A24DFF|nr:putative quinol monooxygenase [Pseudomonas sp. N040]MBF7729805.1 antibiotic biosynthesis monooxygenase [Pseudomonas sp. N040]MBW7013447.1 antibiotic biosynthesis monooxygenase [Pseudomonas sp. N040]